MNTIVESIPESSLLAANRPSRVLLVTQASGGGVGRHFFDLAEGLTAHGVDVVGIYSPRKLDTACRQRLAAGGLPPMYEFPMRRAVHPLDMIDLGRLVRLIRRLGPFDLIHGHSSKGGALARLAARRLKIPSVFTPHAFVTLDPVLKPWARAFYGRIERWLARHTDAIIAVSRDEVEHAGLLGIDSAKTHLVANGIELPDFPPREEVRSRLGISQNELVIGFVGRLTHQKAPEVMLGAYGAAFRDRRYVRLVLVGDGPLKTKVHSQVEKLGLASRVMLLGDVVGTSIMPAFDIFCLSSRYEGMPYVFVEALAAGLPIVSTRVGGATMAVQPDRNGLIVPCDDTVALAGALTHVAKDDELRRRFSAASAERADRFTAKRMVEQTLVVYSGVLAKRMDR